MKYIGFDREEDAELWARKKLGINEQPGFFRALSAVDDNNNFICVVVMTNFSPLNIDFNIAIANKNAMKPKATVHMFNQIFKLAFNQLNVNRITGLIPGKNAESKNIAEHFGFKLEGIMRKAFADDDLHVYGITNDDFINHAWYRG